ncbi:hypothetical protein RI065_06775 [Mycoplasmatota bacterium zrk1]
MNLTRLKNLERDFLEVHPEGFDSEEMKKISKKHNLGKNIEFVHKVCSKEHLDQGINIIEDIIKIVTKSSMVSVFEKVKFRDLVREFNDFDQQLLVDSLYENIYGDEEKGFDMLVKLLSPYKLAKWPIITVFRAYYNSNYDVFMKPSTVKKVISYLELDDIKYNSKPDFQLYNRYREYINILKGQVDKRLSPDNPAFSGFLMLTIN